MADPKEKKGFLSLAQKTIAVISASVTSLVGGQSQAAKMPAGIQNTDTNIEFTYSSSFHPVETELYRTLYVVPSVFNTYKALRSGKSVKYIYNTADSSKVFYKHTEAADIKVEEIILKKLRPLRRA